MKKEVSMKQPTTATLLIQGGTLVTPEGLVEADLLAQGERIKAIGQGLPDFHDTRVIDAEGCYVLPGVIDAHTHIQLDTGIYRTPDDWLIGTRAAACGGVTTVVDFATQFPGQTLSEAVEARLAEAEPAVIDYAFHMMVTDLPPGQEEELGDLISLGVPSLKLYTTYRPNYYADDATILCLMTACADLGIRPLIHCENDALVTAQTEALVEAGETDWRYHGYSRPAWPSRRPCSGCSSWPRPLTVRFTSVIAPPLVPSHWWPMRGTQGRSPPVRPVRSTCCWITSPTQGRRPGAIFFSRPCVTPTSRIGCG
jgi:hypothetical protein